MERSLPTKWKVSANKSSWLLAWLPRHKGPMNMGLHQDGRAPNKCPSPTHGQQWYMLPLVKFLRMYFVKSLLELKLMCLRTGGKNLFFFTSCCIMNSPFQGMCEFLLVLNECCKMFSVNVFPVFVQMAFCVFAPLRSLPAPAICGIWFYLGRGRQRWFAAFTSSGIRLCLPLIPFHSLEPPVFWGHQVKQRSQWVLDIEYVCPSRAMKDWP